MSRIVSRKPYKRTDRISDLVRSVISQALLEDVHHFQLEWISITDVRVTPDLRRAVVGYRIMDDRLSRDVAAERLQAAQRPLQKQLNGALTTRNTPVLEFRFDASLDMVNHIDQLLASAAPSDDDGHS